MADLFRLVLVRHGEAVRQAATDEARPLTERGRAEAAATARQLAALALPGPVVVGSTLLRAQETAVILAATLVPGAAVGTLRHVTPDDDPRRAEAALAGCARPGSTLVVATHMPLVAALVEWMVDGVFAAGLPVPTGGAIVLEGPVVAAGQMRVVRRLGPDGA